MCAKVISLEKSNTKCTASTSFCIVGNFDPEEVTAKLRLSPSKSWKINDRIESKKFQFDAGARRTFSLWNYGHNESYNGDISRQIKLTINDLKPKVPYIKEILSNNDCKAYIEVVCDATAGDITPDFSVDSEIIDFCKLIGATINVDLNIF